MADPAPRYSAVQRRELMLRVARNPEFSCCCIRLSREDRFRARRVFRLSRRLTRGWDHERRATAPPTQVADGI